MAQVELMQSLNDSSPARVGDLASRLRLSASTVSGLISQMMNAGLVDRFRATPFQSDSGANTTALQRFSLRVMTVTFGFFTPPL